MQRAPHQRTSPASISLRQATIGGALSEGKINPSNLLVAWDRIIVLVHGFNVTKMDADRSYDLFEQRLSPDLRRQVVRLYWPGDTSTAADSVRGVRTGASKVLSAISYMLKPPIAMQGSQILRHMLQQAFAQRRQSETKNPLEICFIAHSLGCRLVLETIERIIVATGADSSIDLTVLMAAAVPEYMVIEGGAFADVIRELPRLWILHSRHDITLRRFFRPGQLAERAPFPNFQISSRRALGRKGLVASDKLKVVEGRWDHSDYWTDRDVACAVDAELSGKATLNHPSETLQRTIWRRELEERVAEQRQLASLPSTWY